VTKECFNEPLKGMPIWSTARLALTNFICASSENKGMWGTLISWVSHAWKLPDQRSGLTGSRPVNSVNNVPVIALAAVCIALLLISCHSSRRKPILTALEQSGYAQLTGSSEIRSFLAELAESNETAERINIARTALGSPVEALLVSSEMSLFRTGLPTLGKITIMLVGSQHGTEPSGAEALLLLSREIIQGELKAYLEDMNFIFIPNGNPDGRDLHRRVNSNGVNLSTNFTILSEQESRGLMDVLYRWKPEVVLDVHESAVLKKKSLATQGYLIDFQAQFEAANNPNVDTRIRAFSFQRLLPAIITMVNVKGLPAQRYIGEITDIHQPVTHGGLSLRNLRNMAGMLGSFSFLLENRLDPTSGSYPTPRNIGVRVSKQHLCITTLLQCCRIYRADIMRLSRNARMSWKNQSQQEPLYLHYAYVSDQSQPKITLPLRKLETGELVKQTFEYHGNVVCHKPLTLPTAYVIAAHHEIMKDFFDRHHIEYQIGDQPVDVSVEILHVVSGNRAINGARGGRDSLTLTKRAATYTLRQGDLIVSLAQPARRLIPLFLELESVSSMFRTESYAHLVKEHHDFFVYRVSEPWPEG